MANGKVTTGFSKPYVALYGISDSAVTYTSGTLLARGVDVTVSPESSDDNKFYADNKVAENANGRVTGGTVTLTVDGLKSTAEKLIYGLPTADTAGWIHYNDDASIPDVGIGFIVRTQEEGTEKFVPMVITRARFKYNEVTAATQEADIEWQTTSLEATILLAEDGKNEWKAVGAECSTEAAAETALKAFLDIA